MKKLLTILAVLVCSSVRSQTVQYLGAPNTRIEIRGQSLTDSTFWPTIRDTNFIPSFAGAITFRPQDQAFYGFYNGRWNALNAGRWGQITGNLTNQTDLYDSLLARQFSLSNAYGIKIVGHNALFDSANVRKVDTMYRINDSTIGYKINTISYSFLVRGNSGAGGGAIGLFLPTNVFTVTGSPTSNGTLIGNFNNQNANSFFAGPITGGPGQPNFRQMVIADLPGNIPTSNLAANNINFVIGSSGIAPNFSLPSVVLGATETLNLPNAGPGSTGILTSADWNTFNNKVSTINGMTGTVVIGNADSIKKLPVDTSLRRNGYVLALDSINHKWYLAPNGSGAGVTSVALALPSSVFNISGSPVTSAGTLTGTFANQSQNLGFYSPNGSTGVPAFRAMVNADLPTSGVTAGSYTITNVTLNAQGIITAISNGTGGPILSINGLNAATQVFVPGHSGTNFNISSITATHTFNIPYVNGADTGLVTPASYNSWNNKLEGVKVFGGSPVFGSIVANAADTASITFSLLNAAANSILGNNTGSSATPAYFVPTSTTLNNWFGGTIQPSITLTTIGTSGLATFMGNTLNIPQYGSGTGSTNSNIGAGYRWAVPNTNNIKTAFAGYGLKIDSTSNSLGLTFILDTAHLKDTIRLSYTPTATNGATYLSTNGTNAIIAKKFIATGGLTIDSTTTPGALIFNATGGGGNTNSNIGSGYRFAVPSTNNIKTLFVVGGTLDSTTNTNALTLTIASPFISSLTTTGTSGASTVSGGVLNIPQYQGALTLTTTGSSGAATLIGSTLNIPQYSGGGGVAVDASQTITSGSSLTVTNGNNIVLFNPSSAISSFNITFPATPHNGDYLTVLFGGTITSGSVINNMTYTPNSGQSINAAILPTAGNYGQPHVWKYLGGAWYLLQK